jgi:hypothetical protein
VVDDAERTQKRLLVDLSNHALDPKMIQRLRVTSRHLAVSVAQTARLWSRLEGNVGADHAANVRTQHARAARMALEAADPVTRHEYQRASEAVAQQLAAIERIERGSGRALAKVQCQLAQMETARVAAMALAAQDTGGQMDHAQHLAQQLEQAAQELDLTALAHEEASTA